MSTRTSPLLLLLFILLALAYVPGLFVDIMDVDAAQYASISKEMLDRHSFLEITNAGKDYLDKPPLLFWLAALSFKLFGFYNVTYKLPSLLFSLLAIGSTYRFCRLYHDKQTALLAALFLASSQALFLINNDCRTDTILMGSVIFSVYQLAAYLEREKRTHLILGFLGIGMALLAKGPIGLMVPVLGFSSHFILTRAYKNFFRKEWIGGLLFAGLMLLPMLLGLYRQHGMYGLKFYFWIQSFGRITGASAWQNDTTPLFFTHTFLWSFLPWAFIATAAIVHEVSLLMRNRFFPAFSKEYISTGGFLLAFVAFSFSRYKLPHYIYVVFPFAAIITARYASFLFSKNKERILSFFAAVQLGIIVLLSIGMLLLLRISFPGNNIILFIYALFVIVAMVFYFRKNESSFRHRIITAPLLVIVGVNIALSSHIYPRLLRYQSTTPAARIFLAHKKETENFSAFKTGTYHSLDFYARRIVPATDSLEVIRKQKGWVYTNVVGLEEIQQAGIPFKLFFEGDDYRVTLLSLTFLNPSTRHLATEKRYLLHLE